LKANLAASMEPTPSYKLTFVFINSLILFVIANILEMTLHECGHFLTALALHAPNASLHHNYVNFDASKISVYHTILISSAGPLVSLLIGIIFQVLCNHRVRKDLVFIFQNYMSIFGYIGFFGYVLIAPFFEEGDTGYVFQALGFPLWLVIGIALLSFVVLYRIMARLTRNFVLICPFEVLEMHYTRMMFMKKAVLFPVFLGIIITTLLNLPAMVYLSLFAPICRPFTILWTYPLAVNKNYPGLMYNSDFKEINRFSPIALTFLVIIILINRLLVSGLSF
jgi:hypothetical protein